MQGSPLRTYIEGRARVLGWDRTATPSLDPDNLAWLPLHSLVQSERYARELLEQRVAELEDRLAS